MYFRNFESPSPHVRCRFFRMTTEVMTVYSHAARSWLRVYSARWSCIVFYIVCLSLYHFSFASSLHSLLNTLQVIRPLSLTPYGSGCLNQRTCATSQWVPLERGYGSLTLSTPCSSLRDIDRAAALQDIATDPGHRALMSCRCSLW